MSSGALDEKPTIIELGRHNDSATGICFISSAKKYVSASVNGEFIIWDAKNLKVDAKIQAHSRAISAVGSNGHDLFATGSFDSTVKIWSKNDGGWKSVKTLREHIRPVTALSWSVTNSALASGSSDGAIWIRDTSLWRATRLKPSLPSRIVAIDWSSDGKYLVAGSRDGMIRVWRTSDWALYRSIPYKKRNRAILSNLAFWQNGLVVGLALIDGGLVFLDIESKRFLTSFEGHLGSVECVKWNKGGNLIGSSSRDGSVRIWIDDTGVCVGVHKLNSGPILSIAWLNDNEILCATKNGSIHIINIPDVPLGGSPDSITYKNAKVVLLGDSGVGKSGAALVLSGQKFKPTESTHARKVHKMLEDKNDNGDVIENREVFLWDLAGQPGYRIVHQMHLGGIQTAVIMFDSSNEQDLFSGVRHWCRALNAANPAGDDRAKINKILVASRSDVGMKTVSADRINDIVDEFNFTNFFEISSKSGKNIDELRNSILDSIDWQRMPKSSSPELFLSIKEFIRAESQSGSPIRTLKELIKIYNSTNGGGGAIEDVEASLRTCLNLLDSNGLVHLFSFGDRVLLKPELLDAYTSSLISAARDQPDGHGEIYEEDLLSCNFLIDPEIRVVDSAEEKLLMIALLEDLYRNELVYREPLDGGVTIVFPSQALRDRPEASRTENRIGAYYFSGPLDNIYSTLIVRIDHAGLFKSSKVWRNEVQYHSKIEGTISIKIVNVDEGEGKLEISVSPNISTEIRCILLDFVKNHLDLRNSSNITWRPSLECPNCKCTYTEDQIEAVKRRGRSKFYCAFCEELIDIAHIVPRNSGQSHDHDSKIAELDQEADSQRILLEQKTAMVGKNITNQFDVLICHNSIDKKLVRKLAGRLREHGINPWVDEEQVPPGRSWQDAIEEASSVCKAGIVFFANNGMGPWQKMEYKAIIRRYVDKKIPIIPVIHGLKPREIDIPPFMEEFRWVELSDFNDDVISQIIWGIRSDS